MNKSFVYHWLWLMFLVLSVGETLRGQAEIIFNEEDQDPLSLSLNNFEHLWDHDNLLSIDIFLDKPDSIAFQPLKIENSNLGFKDSPLWLRINLKNPSSKFIQKILKLSNPSLYLVECYITEGNQLKRQFRSGTSITNQDKPIAGRHIAFPIALEADAEQMLWLKVTSGNELWLNFELLDATDYYQSILEVQRVLGLFYGAMILALIFGFSFFILAKDNTFLVFSFFILSSLGFTASVDGFGGSWMVWLSLFLKGSHSALFGAIAGMLFLVLLGYFPGKHLFTPMLDRLRWGILALWLLVVGLVLASPKLGIKINYYLFLLAITWSLTVLFRGVRLRDNTVKFILIGFSILVVAVLGVIARGTGLVDPDFIPRNITHVGFIGFILFMSLGLGDKFRRITQEKAKALVDREEALKMVMDLNEDLEDKVNHRTRELEEKNMSLIEAKEKAESGARAKASFLAAMSHEIRTPLNGIIGTTELLQHSNLDRDQIELIEIIRHSGEHLMTIINDILDFSKIESGKLDLEERDFSLRASIENILDLFGKNAREKDLALLYYMDEKVPDWIRGDSTRITQILANLVNNAIKFTNKGQVVIQVKLNEEEIIGKEDRFSLYFSVMDTGIGIPKDRINSLFRAFEQVDSSTTRKYGGTGLGLAICKKLTELMGGKIWVESKAGEGSNFQFFIDVWKSISPKDQLTNYTLEGIMGKEVLVVDDNRINLRILEKNISRFGLQPTVVDDPLVALDFLKSYKYDLLVFDFMMPVMNGIQLAREVKARQIETPILMLSSSSSALDKDEAKFIDIYAQKPIRQAHMKQHLLQLLGKRVVLKAKEKSKIDFSILSDRLPLNILLAEDNPVNQKVASKLFKRLGYDLALAENGADAFDMVSKTPIDLIFMDMQMPVMDGIEATRKIRAESGIKQPIIIALTANAMEKDHQRCLDAGMNDYLTKPIKISTLKSTLERWGGS